MMRSGYRRTVRAGVAVLGAVVLGLATTACGEDGETADDGTAGGAGDTGSAQQSPSPTPAEESEEPGESQEPEETEPPEGSADTGGDDGGEAAAQVRPFVINFYGEENTGGNPEREPANLVVSEHTSLSSLDWARWDGEQAVASGQLAGIWCMPDCLDDPFDASITLSGPEKINGEVYYTTFEVVAPEAASFQADDLDGERPLARPGG
jgi:hypothetical protein